MNGVRVKTDRAGLITVINAPDETGFDQTFLLAPPRGCDYNPDTKLFTLHAVNGTYTYQVTNVLDYSCRAFIAHKLKAGT